MSYVKPDACGASQFIFHVSHDDSDSRGEEELLPGIKLALSWYYTYKTKLKLDKEVGGGDLSDLRTNVVSGTSTQFSKCTVQA